ncbi:MAG TPA: DedA family protein [Rubrobacteraceae bacterium]|nr:DedA family protein [Rubrobacteraceae bacterium]
MGTVQKIVLDAAPVYVSLVVALVLFLGGLGVPMPGTASLLAAGALVRTGDLDAAFVAPLALLAVVLGDSLSYLTGRYGDRLLPRRLKTSLSWHRAERALQRWGALAIPLTRFLVTPLALPINLIAGSGRYSFRKFLGLDILGEIVWVALFGSLGYLFAESWQVIGSVSGNVILWLTILVLAAIGAYEVYECSRHYLKHAPVPTE